MQKKVVTMSGEFLGSISGANFSPAVLCVFLALISTNIHAQSKSCFDEINIEPGLIAFTTEKHSKLADWYKL